MQVCNDPTLGLMSCFEAPTTQCTEYGVAVMCELSYLMLGANIRH